MSFPRFHFLSGLLLLSLSAGPLAARSAAPYKGAIVEDAATGAVLFEDNADAVSPPASMTKLMTFAVLDDRIRAGALGLQTRVTVTPADTRAKPSIIGLKPNESFPIVELVYAMMIHSANDAALAVAREAGGSVPAFVGMMNAKAAALGMRHTVFRSPNGLPPPSRRISNGDLTTPRDFALLCRYLILHTNILTYTSVKNRAFGENLRFPATPMTNHNRLLGRVAGVDGLKTGFTDGAGFCLAATAKRGSRRIIAVIMDSPGQTIRDVAATELIERGFMARPASIQVSAAGPPPRPVRPEEGGAADDPVIRFAVPR
jgi:D-alanyl-D-alanine carboxypeptidase (penicillin-binding protein 5/6)